MSPRRRKSQSRLNRVRRRKATRSIFLSLLFLLGLAFILLKYGTPLLIQLAIFVSKTSTSSQTAPASPPAILSAPVLDALPEATPSAKIRVTGYGPANTTLSILVNGQPADQTRLPVDGAFDLSIALNEGENIITAQATDDQGNQSPRSSTWRVTRDNQPPKLTLTDPSDGSSFFGDSEKMVEVSGTTDADATLIINGRLNVVSSVGNFTTRIELHGGENQITIVARDRAGNETTEILTLNWQP